MVLLPEQRDFVQRVYGRLDGRGKRIVRRGILSTARKNGKTGLISALALAHIVGPEAVANSQTYSAARSRDQSSVVYNYTSKSIMMSPKLSALTKLSPTAKEIRGLARNVFFKSLSAEAKTKHGLSPAFAVHDELGQVVGETDSLYDALDTAGGAHEEPLSLIISTQAPTDKDLLSLLIDDALRTDDPSVVCMLFAADPDDDIFDEKVWRKANFALDKFRSLADMRDLARRAKRMPSQESTFRNLYLNMRTARESLFVAPLTWKACAKKVNDAVFEQYPVSFGLDLSQRIDLTAAVASVVDDDGVVHQKTFAFTPSQGLEERARQDRAPYPLWVKNGLLIALPGRVIDYDMVIEYLKKETATWDIEAVAFDRWRIDQLKKSANEQSWAQDARWVNVGQGFRDMAPRLDEYENHLVNESLRTGANPVLNMAAAGAIAVKDPAGNRKLEKSRSSARIDPLVAGVMSLAAVFEVGEHQTEDSQAPSDASDLLVM